MTLIYRLAVLVYSMLAAYAFSQNLGNLSPGTNMRSTPSSVIIAILIVPPDDPSRDMASARAESIGQMSQLGPL